jgi:hypothetical protein
MNVRVNVDLSDARKIVGDCRRAEERAMHDLASRSVVVVKEEAPHHGNPASKLQEGIKADDLKHVSDSHLEVDIVVSAERPAQAATTGLMHLPSGKVKPIKVQATDAFDYTRAVIEGTGIFGPRGSVITARRSQMLLIPVPGAFPGQSYITARGQTFLVRPASVGMRPNPFPERASVRLEGEAEEIMLRALAAAGVTQ